MIIFNRSHVFYKRFLGSYTWGEFESSYVNIPKVYFRNKITACVRNIFLICGTHFDMTLSFWLNIHHDFKGQKTNLFGGRTSQLKYLFIFLCLFNVEYIKFLLINCRLECLMGMKSFERFWKVIPTVKPYLLVPWCYKSWFAKVLPDQFRSLMS